MEVVSFGETIRETDKLISSYKKLSELILTKVISSYTNITCIF